MNAYYNKISKTLELPANSLGIPAFDDVEDPTQLLTTLGYEILGVYGSVTNTRFEIAR